MSYPPKWAVRSRRPFALAITALALLLFVFCGIGFFIRTPKADLPAILGGPQAQASETVDGLSFGVLMIAEEKGGQTVLYLLLQNPSDTKIVRFEEYADIVGKNQGFYGQPFQR